MKQIYTTLVFLLFIGSISAQLSITPDVFQYDTKQGEIDFNVDVMNTSSDTLVIYWMYDEAPDFPELWHSQVCDVNLCYTQYPIKAHPDKPLTIPPGEKTIMNIHVNDEGQGGESWAVLIFYSDPNCENEIARTQMPPSSISNINASNISLYPNPVTDFFQLTEDADVKEVVIYSLAGKELAHFNHNPGKSYNVTNLERGIYIVSLMDKEGALMKTLRLRK